MVEREEEGKEEGLDRDRGRGEKGSWREEGWKDRRRGEDEIRMGEGGREKEEEWR